MAVVAGAVLVGTGAVLVNEPLGALVALVSALAIVGKVVALPDSTRSWATGAAGEVLTARALEQLKAEGFVILHDRLIPGTSANIDHVVIGPPGVAVVETKSYSGRLRVRGDEVYVGGYRKTWKTVGEASREAVAVTVALSDALERRRLKVRPILCVHRADLPFFGASLHGISIVDGHGLVETLRTARYVLSSQDVHDLARLANDRLRPALAPPAMPSGWLPNGQLAIPQSTSPSARIESAERFMPPVRRTQIQLAREPQARATDDRTYWTSDGLAPGKAPPIIPPDARK